MHSFSAAPNPSFSNPGDSKLRQLAPGTSCLGLPPLAILAAALASAAWLPTAQAQPARPDGGAVLQQQGSQPLATPRAAQSVLPGGFVPKPVIDRLPTAVVSVTKVTVTGNTVFSAVQLAPLLEGLVGKNATLAQLNLAASNVRQYYQSRGYLLAQAYLPRQDVTQGDIEITVLEGSLGSAKASVKPGARFKQSFAQGMLNAQINAGQVITEAALEAPLLLLTDLPGTSVQSAVSSGSSVGTADLEVTLGDNTGFIVGSVDFDNQGSKFTGNNRLGANLFVNNATGYGDQLSARAQLSLDNRRSNSARLSWQTPVGYYGTQAGASFTKLNYSLIKDFAALQAEGDASTTSWFVSHPMLRTRNANASVTLGRDNKRIEDRTLAVANLESRSINSTRLGLRGDWRDALAGGGFSSVNLAYSSGSLGIAQAAALANDQGATGNKTQGSFIKTNLDLLRLQTITDQVSVLGSLKAQWASKNLASAEKMSLGGANDVRAYPVGEASGDQGYVGTLEARYANADWRIGSAAAVLSVFYDFGSVTINKTPLPTLQSANARSLRGAGLGLSLASSDGYSLRAALAWRLGGQPPTSDADRSPRMWLQASKSF